VAADPDDLTAIEQVGMGLTLAPSTAGAISNAPRPAGALRLTVDLSVGDMFLLDIIDNGYGIPADNSRHGGWADMKHRAEQTTGSLR
jgi:signal transduction histidine kinase